MSEVGELEFHKLKFYSRRKDGKETHLRSIWVRPYGIPVCGDSRSSSDGGSELKCARCSVVIACHRWICCVLYGVTENVV